MMRTTMHMRILDVTGVEASSREDQATADMRRDAESEAECTWMYQLILMAAIIGTSTIMVVGVTIIAKAIWRML